MLSVNPKSRPTIATILEKPFIKKRVTAYIYDFIQLARVECYEPDEIQIEILKEQAVKLGVFNSIIKEISLIDDNLLIKNKYGVYLKKKQDEKKKLEEKIQDLEKQKKLIFSNLKNKVERNNNSVEKNRIPSVEKNALKLKNRKSDYESKHKRPISSKRNSRKASYEDEYLEYEYLEQKIFIPENKNENIFEKKEVRPSSGIYLEKKNLIKNQSYDDNIDINNETLILEKNKILMLTQEIFKIKEHLEKTQNKIEKVEKILEKEGSQEIELDSDISEEEILEQPKIYIEEDDGSNKIIEKIKFLRK
jgi:hypothetical protein